MLGYIGVLGATGQVGKSVVSELESQNIKNVILGMRNIGKNTKYKSYLVDINNKEELLDFCRKCLIVINCVGYLGGSVINVAQSCLEAKTNYIDVSGDEILVNKLVHMDNAFKSSGLCCIHSAGVNPGLTEMLTVLLGKENHVSKIETYFGGNGRISYNAAMDMIRSSKSNNSIGMSYIQDGKILRLKNYKAECIMPAPIDKVICFPIIDMSYLNCISLANITTAYFYNTFANQDILICMAQAKMDNDNNEEKLAGKLVDLFEKEDKVEPYTIIYNSLTKENIVFNYNFMYKGDWNELTGIIAAITGVGVLIGEIQEKGTKGLWNLDNCEWIRYILNNKKEVTIEKL